MRMTIVLKPPVKYIVRGVKTYTANILGQFFVSFGNYLAES